MRQVKIGWLLVLTLFPHISGYSLSYKNETCSSFENGWKDWRIYCPNDTNKEFDLDLYTSDLAIWTLECYNASSSWSDFEVEPGESRYELGSLLILRCPLPDVTFAEIVRKLGLRNVINVTFSSYMSLNSGMKHRHLLDFGTFECLSLASNGFTELPSDLLRDVTKIQEVDLSSNEITTLPFDMFGGLEDLWKIDLNHNRIQVIDWRVFRNSRGLRTLCLKGNLLTTLDDRIFKDAGLSYLDLAENQLENLPNHVFDPTEGLTLNISANKFALLPEKLFDSVSMTHIVLSDSLETLTTLPNLFLSNLTQLRTVVLARNALKVLPETIFWGDIRLQRVDLRGNALSSIPADIFRDAKELGFLDLSGNKLGSLSENVFWGLRKLRQINLERNNLTSISEKLFSELWSLHELNLAFNSIATIHQVAFGDLLNLRVVRLSHNFIDLSENYYAGLRRFNECSNLQKIFLDHNNLDGWFDVHSLQSDMPGTLQFVDMTNNRINFVRFWEATAGSQDVVYDLRHNQVRKIMLPQDSQGKIDILVEDNPFYCGCTLYQILGNVGENSRNNIRVVPGRAVCGEPSWMTSVHVADLRLETFTCRPDDDYRHVYCAEGCDCWWIPHNTTRVIDCSSRNVTSVPGKLIEFIDDQDEYDLDEDDEVSVLGNYFDGKTQWLSWGKSPVKLILANNSLAEIPTLDVSAYEYVTTLVLSHNNISKLSFDVLPPRLETLHLDHNDLKRLDYVASNAIINSASLRELNFEGNQWCCESNTRHNLRMMENKLGPKLLYSIPTCLDLRNSPNTKEAPTIYISYTSF